MGGCVWARSGKQYLRLKGHSHYISHNQSSLKIVSNFTSSPYKRLSPQPSANKDHVQLLRLCVISKGGKGGIVQCTKQGAPNVYNIRPYGGLHMAT